MQTGAGQPHVYAEDVESIKVPVVSKAIQKSIVKKVYDLKKEKDEVEKQINKYAEQREKIIKNFKRRTNENF